MPEPKTLTPGEWLALAGVAAGALFCFQFPFLTAPAFAKQLADFGSELPALTKLGLTIWFPVLLGLNPASIAFYALNEQHSPGKRRALLVVALSGSVAASALCVGAMVAPIFLMAGRIE